MKRIMVVDDHEDILTLTKDILSTKNYEIETASTGEECLRNVERFDPNMILLDIMMPKMSGWEVLDELEKRGIPQKTKTVVFTVKSLWEEDMKRITADPMYHYITDFRWRLKFNNLTLLGISFSCLYSPNTLLFFRL